jgi:thiol-disulfide isomerase/thioredoxin
MRSHLPVATVLLAGFFSGSFLSHAQSTLPLPGCEAAPEVQKVLDEKLDWNLLEKMKYAERTAYQRKVLEDLMARYPREAAPVQRYSNLIKQDSPDEYATLRTRLVQQAKDHPDDPLALLLAGKALMGKDTPEGIRLLEAARDKAPAFPLPALSLAATYTTGKRVDQNKMKANLEAYFAACPASTDGHAQWLLVKDQPLQPKVAVALRARLEKDTDPKKLEDYETLWGLEFRTRSPKEHDALRAQVARDLERLEKLNPKGDADWLAFLVTGYKQSGTSKEAVTATEDRLLHDFPHSNQAWRIVDKRWEDTNKEPEDQTDAVAWAKYQKAYEEALKGWIRDYPDNDYLQHDAWFSNIEDEDGITEKDGISAMDSFLQAVKDYQEPRWCGYSYSSAASFLIKNKWQLTRALDLLQRAKVLIEKNSAADADDDNVSDENAKDNKKGQIRQDLSINGLILKAAIEAGQPEQALKLKAVVEAPPPEEKKFLSAYWLNRARLEAVQKHTQDALAYYQLALLTRTQAPKAWRGKLHDDLTDEARALWKEQGGTETAWAVWSKQPAGSGAEQVAEGRWEKATKKIPDFELTDLSGKTWRLKELGGKTLLITLWATWCGPCQFELPHLEKFYEKVKDHKDIQILTFDIDEDLGVVAPFLKEKSYTFPVLPAYSTVVSLLDGFAIPQTWLVDSHGVWQWKQLGYSGGSDADFEKEMLDRVKSIETSH